MRYIGGEMCEKLRYELSYSMNFSSSYIERASKIPLLVSLLKDGVICAFADARSRIREDASSLKRHRENLVLVMLGRSRDLALSGVIH